jgi:hypothetical protein
MMASRGLASAHDGARRTTPQVAAQIVDDRVPARSSASSSVRCTGLRSPDFSDPGLRHPPNRPKLRAPHATLNAYDIVTINLPDAPRPARVSEFECVVTAPG